MGDLLGYARISTLEQNSRLQTDALKAAGCYRVFTDRASGALDERRELAKLFDQVRPGDTVVVGGGGGR
jgi:DNA invertase Pin-like site-specific DNA recombinase